MAHVSTCNSYKWTSHHDFTLFHHQKYRKHVSSIYTENVRRLHNAAQSEKCLLEIRLVILQIDCLHFCTRVSSLKSFAFEVQLQFYLRYIEKCSQAHWMVYSSFPSSISLHFIFGISFLFGASFCRKLKFHLRALKWKRKTIPLIPAAKKRKKPQKPENVMRNGHRKAFGKYKEITKSW